MDFLGVMTLISCQRSLNMNVCSIVGGLSLRSIRNAWEKLYAGSSWTEDAPCCSSPGISLPEPSATVHWVSPWRTAAVHEDDGDFESKTTPLESQPRSLQDGSAAGDNDWDSWSDSEVDIYVGEEEFIQERWLKADRDYEGDWEEEEESDEEDGEWDSSVSTGYRCDLRGLFPLLQKAQQVKSWGSESALEELRDGESIIVELSMSQRFHSLTHVYRNSLKGMSSFSKGEVLHFSAGPFVYICWCVSDSMVVLEIIQWAASTSSFRKPGIC